MRNLMIAAVLLVGCVDGDDNELDNDPWDKDHADKCLACMDDCDAINQQTLANCNRLHWARARASCRDSAADAHYRCLYVCTYGVCGDW